MGNCASYPKTNEGEAPVPVPVPVPEPVAEEVKVEQQENKAEENVVEAKTEETPVASADNSLVTLLNEVYTLVTKIKIELNVYQIISYTLILD